MNILNEVINRLYPGAELSCRECGSDDVVAHETSGVSLNNPLGERMLILKCNHCGFEDDAVSPAAVVEAVKDWLVKVTTTYTCWFWFGEFYLDASTDKGIGEFKDGFWINSEFRFTKGSDCEFWIPPGRIDHVIKAIKQKRLSE